MDAKKLKWVVGSVLVFLIFMSLENASKIQELKRELGATKAKDNAMVHEHGQRVKWAMAGVEDLQQRLEPIEAIFNADAEIPSAANRKR